MHEVAKEVICLTFKGETSLAMYQEVSIKGCDLFSAEYDCYQNVKINQLDYHSHHRHSATRDGFTESKSSHYYPKWAEFMDVSKYCSNHV